MKGDLELPEAKPGGTFAAVLILHGSAGIDGRGEFHGKTLNAAGIGTLAGKSSAVGFGKVTTSETLQKIIEEMDETEAGKPQTSTRDL